MKEIDLTNKKYVDEQDTKLQTKINLKVSKWGDSMTGELDMNDNKITDLGTPTNNSDASTKKYVDDEFTNKITDINVLNTGYTVANAEATAYVDFNMTNAEIKKLKTLNVHSMLEKHFHFAFGGTSKGFANTSGRALIAYGGFNRVSGRCTFAQIKLRGMGYIKKNIKNSVSWFYPINWKSSAN